MGYTFVHDTETLPNRTLYCAKNIDTGERFSIWRHEENAPARLRAFLSQPDCTFVSFNGDFFDDCIIAGFIGGLSEREIKNIADNLIMNGLSPWQARARWKLIPKFYDTIDLKEVAPSFVGLKAFGARLNMPILQDMPIKHDENLKPEQEEMCLAYCHNDCDTTEALLLALEPEIMLRIDMSRKYNTDMRSKSDSQMAEQAYITSMGLDRKSVNKIPHTVRYKAPSFIKFSDASLTGFLTAVQDHVFDVNQKTGHIILPDFLGKQLITFKDGSYQLGVGGIHSTHDVKVCHVAGDYVIEDIDAASFYPSIILECGFGPAHLGQAFVDEYRSIYTNRLAAKKAKDKVTDATLKISLNGTFGKLASMYSVLYSPDLMLAVTLTGQFTLLMLIEWLDHIGVECLSANTDGIAVRYEKSKRDQVKEVVAMFEKRSGFNFEFTGYRVLAMANVNNYFAVKDDRSVKTKGIYAETIDAKTGKVNLKKNPTASVCADAVSNWLAHGTPFEETIRNAPFRDFLSARNVTGGAVQNGEYLGKVVRWYISNDDDYKVIQYASNGNKVPKTDNARAAMVIHDFVTQPDDLARSWYLKEACKIAEAVGCYEHLPEHLKELIKKPEKKRKKKE